MNFGEFMASLHKSVKHVYLLSGEESYYIEKAEARILEKLFPGGEGKQDALQIFRGDVNLDELMGSMETAPFFADKTVVLVKNTVLFKEKKSSKEDAGKSSKDKKQERFLKLLEDMPDYSYVIFVTNEKADKRRKLYKTIEKYGAVLEAEAVRAWNINDWLQGKLQSINKDLDRDAYVYFTSAISMMQQISLSYLDKEFDKLALFSSNRRITKKEIMDVFADVPEVSVFSMLDAISARDVRKSLLLLKRQMDDGVYFPLILSLLVRHVRQLWQAKVLQSKGIYGKSLAKPLELNPFIAEKLGRAAKAFKEVTLKRVMLELVEADYLLKTGQAGEEILEHAVILLCSEED